MKIHYYGTDSEKEGSRLQNISGAKGGNAAFLDIHYHGDEAMTATNPAVRQPGQAAFLDIHYHGDQAMLEGNPALGKGGQAAFLDIHYHGDQALGGGVMRESGEAEGGMVTAGRAVTNAISGKAMKPGGAAAFLDIHYNGDEATAATNPAVRKPGSAAFVEIHYHGDKAAMLEENPVLSKAGQAAFLDIHYHGDQAMGGGVMRESAEAEGGLISRSSLSSAAKAGSVKPSLGGAGGPGTAAFVDIHYHGKTLTDADVKGVPGLHIGNAALLDIHYHG